jgi:hypothetical protein
MSNYKSDQNKLGAIHGWHVYVVAESGDACHVKIGTAANIKYRLSSLQPGNPRKLTLVASWHFNSRADALSVERAALAAVGDGRLVGRDWIKVSPALVVSLVEETIVQLQVALRA